MWRMSLVALKNVYCLLALKFIRLRLFGLKVLWGQLRSSQCEVSKACQVRSVALTLAKLALALSTDVFIELLVS